VGSARVVDLLKHVWLPAVVLGVAGTARLTRVMRANLLDELIVELAPNAASLHGGADARSTRSERRCGARRRGRQPGGSAARVLLSSALPVRDRRVRRERPVLREISGGHLVRCDRAEELTLTGADGADERGERR